MLNDASIRDDGTCVVRDEFDGTEVVWPDAAAWARAWIDEHAREEYGPACEFAGAACDEVVPGIVDVLVVLSELAVDDEELLALVGAGPIEHLVSHSGKGELAIDDVERAWRRNAAFRAALAGVWFGSDLPATLQTRLARLGCGRVGGSRE